MNMHARWSFVVVAAVLATGCSTVKLKPGAAEIEVLKADRVAECRKLGSTTVSVAEKLGFIPRGDKAIQTDLHRLARNSAAGMDGDTISPEGPVEEGEQTFGVYDCI